MDYKQAGDIRKKSFGSLLAEQEGGLGSSLKKSISLKTQAKMTGIKEKFDPMNIAKKLTGGSNWAPAMLGKLTGRDHKAMEYFAGAKPKKGLKGLLSSGEGDTSSPAEILGLIYEELKKADENRKLDLEEQKNKQEEEDKEEDIRNALLIKALTGRGKRPPTRKEKKAELRAKKKEEKKKPEAAKPAPKVPTKEAPKPSAKPAEVPVPKAPTPKAAEIVKPKAPAISTAVKVAAGAAIVGAPIGALSAQFESSKSGAAAIGYDSTGGTSYGTYQLASKKGVVKEFLSYLAGINPEWANTLSSAGNPDTGSTKGDFPNAWRKIATDNPKEFGKIQHNFIELKHYQPTVKALAKINYDVNSQPAAIKDVVWSTAVQHGSGGAASIFKQAIEQSGGVDAKPEKIISKVYEIRRTKFGSSTENVRAGVNKRFDIESKMALTMLNDSGSQISSSSKENKDLKESLNSDKPSVVQTINNNNTSQTTSQSSPTKQKVDDRPAIIKKAQG